MILSSPNGGRTGGGQHHRRSYYQIMGRVVLLFMMAMFQCVLVLYTTLILVLLGVSLWFLILITKIKKRKKECLQLLISSISNMAKSMGKKFMYSLLKSKTLIDIYEEDGYIANPQSYTEMIKII